MSFGFGDELNLEEMGDEVMMMDANDDGRSRHQQQAAKQRKKRKQGWQSFDLDAPLIKALVKKGYRRPTPIQKETIPVAVLGKDVAAMARTGSGKTAAFLLPLLQRLKVHSLKVGIRGVVLSPTRELAQQTFKVLLQLAKFTDLRCCMLIGGDSMEAQFSDLARNPDVVVATPGRLIHIMLEAELTLGSAECIVFDEADRLFEMGFEEQMREILRRAPQSGCQKMLFSATMPKQLASFARSGFVDPAVVRLDSEMTLSPDLELAFFTVRTAEKDAALLHLLSTPALVARDAPTLVFAATWYHVEYAHMLLKQHHIASVPVYGKMDPEARRNNVDAFRDGQVPVMIVTDVAARGIDIPLLDYVINYSFPPKEKLFVHRVGRVARAGRSGTAYSLVARDELPYMLDLYLFLGAKPKNSIKQSEEQHASSSGGGGGDTDDDASSLQSKPFFYGRIPHDTLTNYQESIDNAVKATDSIQLLLRPIRNATKLYMSTRPAASVASVKRARTLNNARSHPLFVRRRRQKRDDESDASDDDSHDSEQEEQRQALIASIAKFRPPQTIMEVAARAKGSMVDRDVMRYKRVMHERLLDRNLPRRAKTASDDDDDGGSDDSDANEELSASDLRVLAELKERKERKERELASQLGSKRRLSKAERRRAKRQQYQRAQKQKKPAPSKATAKKYRDESFYMPMVSDDKDRDDALNTGMSMASGAKDVAEIREFGESRSIDQQVMELVADDASEIFRQRNVLRWDKSKKKYVQEKAGAKRMRDEGGNMVSMKNYEPKRYEKWKQQTHMSIPSVGDVEREDETSSAGRYRVRRSYGRFADRNKKAAAAGNTKPELKNADQLRKAERLKHKNAFRQKRGWKGEIAQRREQQRPRGGPTAKFSAPVKLLRHGGDQASSSKRRRRK
jgi:ATP-dependent RNA helicase DDX54/DBP10